MAERIARHRAQRPPTWRTVEAPLELPLVYGEATTLILEDLTLLLSNLMQGDSATAEEKCIDQVNALLTVDAHVILVSNEVGMGVVPPYLLGRVFRDALGRVNQAAAAACGEVYLLVAGLPLRLK
jgi:adenosylcobinamide kinase / adenosylcobinamide-phosphate guanylyltransferase